MELEIIYRAAIGAIYLYSVGGKSEVVFSLMTGAVDLSVSLEVLYEKPQGIINCGVGKNVVFVQILGLDFLKAFCLEIVKLCPFLQKTQGTVSLSFLSEVTLISRWDSPQLHLSLTIPAVSANFPTKPNTAVPQEGQR